MSTIAELERRVYKLERLIKEKSATRSHAPSKVFLIWKYLYDNGGAKLDRIKMTFPEDERNSIAGAIASGVEDGIIKQTGETYFANREYSWDDIGLFDDDDKQMITKDLQYLLNRVQ